jgi:purine-binding chemotaxis protein CheW
MLGMMRLRETIVPVIDLRVRFGFAGNAVSYSLSTPIITVDTPAGAVGMVVDEVDDLERIDTSQITPHDGSTSRYVTGVARLPDYLLLLLDVSLIRAEIPA